MYTIEYENKNKNYSYEFQNLKDIFKTNTYSKVEKEDLSTIFDKIDSGITILKYISEKDDYQILYTNNIFWKDFNTKLHENLPGCLFNEVLSKINKDKKIHIQNNSNAYIKLYENNELIKAWQQKTFKENGLIYLTISDKTYYYLSNKEISKYNDKNLFQKFKDLIINIADYSNTGYTIKTNEGFYWTNQINQMLELDSTEKINFSKENIIYQYATTESINKIKKTLQKVGFEKPQIVEYEVKTPNKNTKYFRSYIQEVQRYNETYEVSYTHDITEEYQSKIESTNLQENINRIMDFSKICITTYENGKHTYTPGIYDILEIDKPEDYPNNEIIKNLMYEKDQEKLNKLFENVSPENPEFYITFKYNSGKNNIIYLSGYNKAFFTEKGELIRIVTILQDVTEEILAKNDALRLTEDFNIIQHQSKIALCEFEDDKYYFTPETYNITKVNPEDYPDTVDIVSRQIVPEDRARWREALNLSPQKPEDEVSYRIINAQNELRYLNVHNKAIFNSKGEILRKVGFIQDVTEETLAKMEAEDLKLTVDEIQGFSKIFLASFEGGNFTYTDEVYNILGVSPEEHPPETLFDFMIPEDKERFYKLVTELSPENPAFKLDYKAFKPNGEPLYISAYNKATFNEDGELIRINVFEQDVTEETIAKKEALELKNNLDIIEGFSKIVIGYYEDGEYNWSPELYNILKIDSKDYPKNVDLLKKFASPNDNIEFLDIIKFLNPENNTCSTIRELNDSEGNLVYLKYQLVGNFNKKGKLKSVTGFLQDVTEETLIKHEALKLSDNFQLTQDASKMGFARLENGKYYYTSEIYKILGIHLDVYPDGEDFMKYFIVSEDYDKYNDIFNLTPDNSSKQISYRIHDVNGELKYINAQIKAKYNKHNELNYVVGFLQDVTEETLAKNEALELQNSINTLGAFSKISIGYFKDGVYSWTPEIYNILKIDPEEYSNDIDLVAEFSTPEDNQSFFEVIDKLSPDNNTFSTIRTICDNEGNIKYLNLKHVVEFDNNGRMVSVHKFIQDVTEETLAKESALELQREVGIIQKGSKIALVHYQNGEFYWTSKIYDILEIDNPDDYPKHVDLLDLFLVPEEKGSFKRKMAEVSCDNSSFTLTGTIKTVKGNIKYVEGYQEFQFDDEGEIVEFVAFIHEITDKVSRQKELEDLSEERKILLLEIQDRIKNNLQLLKSYLNLDNRYYDNNHEYVIERTQKRLNVMSLSYEIIYNSENVSNLNLSDLLESLITKLYLEENIGNFKNIQLHYNIDSSIYVDINDFMILAYIVASLANNTYKHAFPGEKSGNFYIEAENLGENIVLKVWDDGVGLSEDIELSEISNMGFLIIINLINQLEGEYKILEDVPGFGVELTFKS